MNIGVEVEQGFHFERGKDPTIQAERAWAP